MSLVEGISGAAAAAPGVWFGVLQLECSGVMVMVGTVCWALWERSLRGAGVGGGSGSKCC